MSKHVVRFASITYSRPDGQKEHAYVGDEVELNEQDAEHLTAIGAVVPAEPGAP